MKIPNNDNIITIKLVTGEEVVAKLKSTDDTSVTITKPVVIMMSPQGLAFGSFTPTMDSTEGLTLNKTAIMSVGLTLDKVAKEYTNATSSIKTPPKSSLIV